MSAVHRMFQLYNYDNSGHLNHQSKEPSSLILSVQSMAASFIFTKQFVSINLDMNYENSALSVVLELLYNK